ncbi:MAG: hypothetical protein RIE31_12035 [Alphaproteobacteria bacterium]
MTDPVETFGRKAHDILRAEPGPAGVEKVRAALEPVLTDAAVRRRYFGPDNTAARTPIYEDKDLGFVVLAHVSKDSGVSKPHDHGPTWAIYGQVSGETEMTEYEEVAPARGDTPGTVRPTRTYRMTPGVAVAYGVGAIHAPTTTGPTQLIRIEGRDATRLPRRSYARPGD